MENKLPVKEKAESKLYRIVPRSSLYGEIDSDHTTYVYLAQHGVLKQRFFVVLNGVKGPEYDDVSSLQVGTGLDPIVYAAKRGGRAFLVVNGAEQRRHHSGKVFNLGLSPDGKHTAFTTNTNSRWVVVVDGEESGGKWDDTRKPEFSPDSKHTAYIGERLERKNKMSIHILLDGKDVGQYEQAIDLKFSPDSDHLRYLAQQNSECFAVIDGLEKRHYKGIGLLTFSPSNARVAYVAQEDNKRFLVVDDVPQEKYSGVGLPAFSPDSKRIAYEAYLGAERLIVVDGVAQEKYIGHTFPIGADIPIHVLNKSRRYFISKRSLSYGLYPHSTQPVFSPDSKHVAYMVNAGRHSFVVVDNVLQEEYHQVTQPVFSPDSKHLVYTARKGKQWFVVLDGIRERGYISVTKPVFSDDSQHLAYWARRRGSPLHTPGWVVVLDGIESETSYGGSLLGPSLAKTPRSFFGQFSFESSRYLYALTTRKSEFFRLEITIDGETSPGSRGERLEPAEELRANE